MNAQVFSQVLFRVGTDSVQSLSCQEINHLITKRTPYIFFHSISAIVYRVSSFVVGRR